MDEIVPVILGFVLGVLIWRGSGGWARLAFSCLAVAVIGTAATVLSGEYNESWVYLLLDFGEAAFGLAVGIALAHRVLPEIRSTPSDRHTFDAG